jgi:hypothetical protein
MSIGKKRGCRCLVESRGSEFILPAAAIKRVIRRAEEEEEEPVAMPMPVQLEGQTLIPSSKVWASESLRI